jgi:uroporphyrinogen decarboxylase
MIEGRSSDRELAKIAALRGEAWFCELIDRLVEESVEFLSAQIEAGADVVQIFESWAGDLCGDSWTAFVEQPLAAVIQGLRARHGGVPAIVFARGAGVHHVDIQRATEAEAIGVESQLPLKWAVSVLADSCALQGNLDPLALLACEEIARREAVKIASAVPLERHVFNLGHGIRPDTRPEAVSAVIEAVRQFDRSAAMT